MTGYASEWLLEIGAYDGANEITLRYSSSGYVTGPNDDPPNAIYDARISALSAFERHLFGARRTMGEASLSMGEVVLANADGVLDEIKSYGFDGRRFVLRRLPSRFSAFPEAKTMLTGTLEGLDSGSGMVSMRIRFYDRRRDIDVPIQENEYGGTTTSGTAGGADGTPDQKGVLKPLVFGRALNVPGILVDPYKLIIQVSDGAVSEITAYDGGVPLIYDGDVANLSALEAVTGNPGHYRTCLARGLWKPLGAFNGRPAYVWTADVTEGATLPDRRAGAVAERMLARIGSGADIDSASFSALNAKATQEVGIYIDTQTSAMTAVREVLSSVGAGVIPNAQGVFTVERIEEPGVPVASVDPHDIITSSPSESVAITPNPDTEGAVPTHKINLQYGRLWHVHSESDIGGCVTVSLPERAERLKQEWLETRASDDDVLIWHKLSEPLEIDTLLLSAEAATAEAERRLTLYGVQREVIEIGVPIEDAEAMQINATIEVTLGRIGYETGKPMVIIGRGDDWQNETARLTLWG